MVGKNSCGGNFWTKRMGGSGEWDNMGVNVKRN